MKRHVFSKSGCAAGLLLLVLLSACSPRLSPLYRDFRVHEQETPLKPRIEKALQEAGWRLAPSAVENVIATEPRTMSNWGLYRVQVALEVAPVGGDYVRVYVHPYRKYITGGQSKIPYLSGNLQQTVMANLNAAMKEEGLRMQGEPYEEDEKVAVE